MGESERWVFVAATKTGLWSGVPWVIVTRRVTSAEALVAAVSTVSRVALATESLSGILVALLATLVKVTLATAVTTLSATAVRGSSLLHLRRSVLQSWADFVDFQLNDAAALTFTIFERTLA